MLSIPKLHIAIEISKISHYLFFLLLFVCNSQKDIKNSPFLISDSQIKNINTIFVVRIKQFE